MTGNLPADALVFAPDYHPGQRFRVFARLPAPTTVAILDGPGDRNVPSISQPDEYWGYVIQYRFGERSVYALAFSRDPLGVGRWIRIGTDATVFSPVLNLIEVAITSANPPSE